MSGQLPAKPAATVLPPLATSVRQRLQQVFDRAQQCAAKGERGIWQRRYWEHTLRDESDFERHCDYIHFNPVKNGYVRAAHEWPHSSLHRFLKLGIYPAGWAGGEDASESDFGER